MIVEKVEVQYGFRSEPHPISLFRFLLLEVWPREVDTPIFTGALDNSVGIRAKDQYLIALQLQNIDSRPGIGAVCLSKWETSWAMTMQRDVELFDPK